MKKIIALALCAAMLLSLAACGGGSASDAVEPTPTPAATPQPTPEPTPDPLDEAMASYEKSMADILAADDLSYRLEVSIRRTVDGLVFEESAVENVMWQGMQTDSPLIFRDRDVNLFGYELPYKYMYADGTVYVDGDCSVSMSAGDYIATLYPLSLLDVSLYGGVELAEGELLFSGPTAPEAWLGIGAEQFISGEGRAVLENGAVSALSYTASYDQNGVETVITVEIEIGDINSGLDLSAKIPSGETSPLSDICLVELLDRLLYSVGESGSESSNFSAIYLVQAGALYMTDFIELNKYGSGDDMIFKLEETQEMTESGQEYSWLTTCEFADGVYTVDADGQVKRYKYDAEDMAPGAAMVNYVIPADFIESAVISQENGYLLVEFECYAKAGEEMQSGICGFLYDDMSILDDLASGFETDKFRGHLAFNMDSMLPTGYSVEFEGRHNIDGMDYIISLQSYLNLDLASYGAYENITGELLPEDEPETKATPLFYKVTGENGQEMWLLGTIHVGDERTAYLPESIYNALSASDALAVEVNLHEVEDAVDNDEQFMSDYVATVIYSDGSLAKDHLDEEIYTAALSLMKAVGGYNMNTDYFKPVVWSGSIEDSFLFHTSRLCSEKGVDERLLHLAEEMGLEIRAVEDYIGRAAKHYGFSDALQQELLAGSLSYSRYEYAAEVEELYEAWCLGDEEALRALLSEEGEELTQEEQLLYDEYAQFMYIDRNKLMLDTAIGYLESGETVFFAVGLAHLIGMDGLVDSLREAGYTVEIVK